ncbi:MAG TPA: GNAT family N-acetyltransferase [Acidimicrobiales bacterium]|nr:GNAT family N-acetyltransferase [Acidimicrobiales bacterium]
MPDQSWQRPEPLTANHVLTGFSCGKPELDAWLTRRAVGNQASGATKTHVVVDDGRVIGFYALATGAVAHSDVGGRSRRNMPEPIPTVILARMALDEKYRSNGLGPALLQAAIETTMAAAQTIGIACLLVHAKDEDARDFYLHFDFEPSPTDPLHLILKLADVPTGEA